MRLLALLLVAIALPAAAAPAPSATAAPDAAREHYERGLAKYNLADFDAAIVEFKQSYELSKAPRLLFNIAQAFRLKKDYESALYFYNTYLRADPNPPNLSDVESKIDEMKHALDEQRKSAPTLAVTIPPPPPLPPPVDKPRPRRGLKIAGVTLAALGVAGMAVGGGLLGLASSNASTLHKVAQSGMPWTAADDTIFTDGDRANSAGIALLSAGGALVIAGGITLYVGLRR
jgi:tetratricopeptide (TPR) repeat protein